MKKVAVLGAKGRMGATVCQAVEQASDLELVARLDQEDQITPDTLAGAEVVVEFTNPSVTKSNVLELLKAGVDVVVGTSGWDEAAYQEVKQAAETAGHQVLIAPNFALSAVLVMAFAKLAAPFFTSGEVVEIHHPQKLDAPSGTAQATAQQMNQARRQAHTPLAPDATVHDPHGARGDKVGDIAIHSLRLAGANAHQSVLLGNPGEQLELRTDCYDRFSFMPGVLLAVRKVGSAPGLIIGLEHLMDLGIG